MKRFRQHVTDRTLNEGSMSKAAVTVYANTSKRHGDQAEASFNRARHELQRALNQKPVDKKINDLSSALLFILDGLISTRKQIGAVSAQITASRLLKK